MINEMGEKFFYYALILNPMHAQSRQFQNRSIQIKGIKSYYTYYKKDNIATKLIKMLKDSGYKNLVKIKDKETVRFQDLDLTLFAPFVKNSFFEDNSKIGNLIDSAIVFKADNQSNYGRASTVDFDFGLSSTSISRSRAPNGSTSSIPFLASMKVDLPSESVNKSSSPPIKGSSPSSLTT